MKINRYEITDWISKINENNTHYEEELAKVSDILQTLKYKKGFWRAPDGTENHNWKSQTVFFSDDIGLTVAFDLDDLKSWDDFNNIEVIDEEFGQPYTPFFHHQELNTDIPNNSNYLEKVVTKYNKYMDSLVDAGLLERVN